MKMWIARDKCNELHLFSSKPQRIRNHFGDFHTDKWIIDENLFPEVTFENSPKKVKIELI